MLSRDTAKMYDAILHEPLRIRNSVSRPAQFLLDGLLQKNPSNRLGTANDFGDLVNHEFFASISWPDLEAKRIKPPYNPNVKGPMDLSQLDPGNDRQWISQWISPWAQRHIKREQYITLIIKKNEKDESLWKSQNPAYLEFDAAQMGVPFSTNEKEDAENVMLVYLLEVEAMNWMNYVFFTHLPINYLMEECAICQLLITHLTGKCACAYVCKDARMRLKVIGIQRLSRVLIRSRVSFLSWWHFGTNDFMKSWIWLPRFLCIN